MKLTLLHRVMVMAEGLVVAIDLLTDSELAAFEEAVGEEAAKTPYSEVNARWASILMMLRAEKDYRSRPQEGPEDKPDVTF